MTAERPDERTEGEISEDPEALGATGTNGDAPDEGGGGVESGAGAERDAGGEEQQALQERFLRLAAEYDNFRKRTERERTESWIRAQAELVRKLIEPLDDLQRVADYTVEGTAIETLLEGVQMVERKLLRALEGAGMEVIDASGQPFDPTLHEALMTAPASDPEEDDSVGEVFQKGYGFKGVLLRPARVQVRKYEG